MPSVIEAKNLRFAYVRVPVLEEQIKVANHRIEDLEKERGE